MNATAPYLRLLWKELRVLRSVWLMCGLGVTFLMLVILAIGESSRHSQGYSAAFWVFMVWIPPVYVLAALATMFAGERDDGTLVWLTALSPHLISVVFSRLLFVVVTGIALQAWYGLSALLLSQFDEPVSMSADDSVENLIVMSFLLVEALAFGMFWSLQTTRPLNAILFAAITIIVVNSGAVMLTEALGGRMQIRAQDALGYAFGFWGWARCVLVIAVMVANWKMAGQWLGGRPWNWEWAAAWWSRRTATTAAETKKVAALPAEASEPWRRTWQRLRWLEWQGIRTFVWIVLALTGLACFSVFFRMNGQPTFGYTFANCWLVLILGGLMAWHGEQSQQRFRALVRLGVSPIAFWMNKLACWFTATVLAVVTIQGTTAAWWTFLSQFERSSQAGYHSPIRAMWAEWMSQPQASSWLMMSVCYALLLFALGFTCSHLLRKTVLSFGVALIGAALLSPWLIVCGEFRLPWFLFLAPLPLWLLCISASALPAWWTEQTTWRIPYRRWGTLAVQTVFPVLLLALAAGYRVWEVPTVPAIDPAIDGDRMTSMNAALVSNLTEAEKQWHQLSEWIHKPLVLPPEIAIPDHRQDQHFLQPLYLVQYGNDEAANRRALVKANQETIDEITHRVLSIVALPTNRSSTDQTNWNHLYAPLTLYAAQHALEDGDADKSLQYLQAAAQMSGMVRRLIPPNQAAAYPPPLFRQEMLRWAQHPQQTESTLRRGLQMCAAALRYWQTQPEELYDTWKRERQETDNAYWPWEQARARKLVDVAYSNRCQFLRMCRHGRVLPSMTSSLQTSPVTRLFMKETEPEMAAWKFSVSEFQRGYYEGEEPVYGLEHGIINSMFVGENQYRATLALMAVVGHRRLHGTLPGSLLDLQRYFEPPSDGKQTVAGLSLAMDDVWTRSSFGYAPQGFPVHEPEFGPTSVYRQPLLWTAESMQYRVDVRGNQIRRSTSWQGLWTHAPIREDSAGDDKSWLFPIPPQDHPLQGHDADR